MLIKMEASCMEALQEGLLPSSRAKGPLYRYGILGPAQMGGHLCTDERPLKIGDPYAHTYRRHLRTYVKRSLCTNERHS